MITYTWDDVTQSTRGDLTAVIDGLQTLYATDPEMGGQDTEEFFRTLQGLGGVEVMNLQEFSSSPLMQVNEFRWVIEAAGKNLVTGGLGNDWIDGTDGATDGADAMAGYAGNGRIYGDTRNDFLNGGE